MKRMIFCLLMCRSMTGIVNADGVQTPLVLTTTPVFRTTAQIMQGQVPAPVKGQTPQASGPATPGTPLVVNHFTVADYQETGQYGPSAESSVGSTQLLVASKGRIRSFLKNGTLDNVLNLAHDSFFSPITLGGFTADPNVIFHPQWKQWIIFANAQSSLVLAVSDGDPITPNTVWSFYVVDSITAPCTDPTKAECFTATSSFDYTTLGADVQAVYCAANIIDTATAEGFVSAAAYVLPRSSLMNGVSAKVFAFRNLTTVDDPIRPFTFQPALNFDAAPTAGIFPSIDFVTLNAFNASSLILVSVVTFTNGIPTSLSDPISVPVDTFAQPISVSVLGTPDSHMVAPVAGCRLAPSHIRNNRLWLVANTGVNNNGVSPESNCSPIDTTKVNRDAAQFTQIDVSRPTNPVLVSQGTLFQQTASNNLGERSFLTPSIMSNANGNVIIGATTCGASERLNAAVAQLIEDNTAVGTPILYTSSTSDYDAGQDWEFVPLARWGDHTRISPDPENPALFWTSQQWCSQENTWALEAAQVLTQ